MKNKLLIVLGVLAVIGAIAGGVIYAKWDTAVQLVSMAVNYVKYLGAPQGTTVTELAPGYTVQGAPAQPAAAAQPNATADDWPSYNKTLTSERFSPLNQIDTSNASGLKVLCTYDTGEYTGFNSGLIEVNNSLIFTTQFDIFSIDPATCRENWRTREDYHPATPQPVSRGAAYLDGLLFRGSGDGRVLAYDFKTGKRVWETRIANPKIGESAPAAPIAWEGLVFNGNAGSDIKGGKGHMYALDAKTGKIVWEFYMVPKTEDDPARGPIGASPPGMSTWKNAPGIPITGGGMWSSFTLDPATGLLYIPVGNPGPDFANAVREGENLYTGSVVVLDAKTGNYKTHFQLVPKDWHDYDVSNTPALIHTQGGKQLMSVAPKNGYLYGIDLATNATLYRTPVTKFENADAQFEAGKSVHFCPGSVGGAEWNGAAYDPKTNLILIGEVEWCTTVTLQRKQQLESTSIGKPWSGEASWNPFNIWGKPDPVFDWAGWVYAVDADTGAWKWRLKSNYPIQSGMTPTAGGIVFFGDMGGNFYVLDAANGQKLWGRKIGGAIGGGVITYTANGTQKIAVATGLTEILWPTEITTAKVSILGLGDSSVRQ
ncbi:MAG: pyrroloquinoline quinone-dependent dehydrogenase [Rhodomicrobium sp.]